MKLFVTVGSTGFNELVDAATSIAFLTDMSNLGFTSILIQYGSSRDIFAKNIKDLEECDIDLQGYDYKTNIEQDIAQADFIISHSGAGTILQALRLHKKLVIVVNKSLSGNHQTELAQMMATKNYVIYGDISNLSETVSKASKHHLAPFPAPNTTLFANTLDKQMGFTSD